MFCLIVFGDFYILQILLSVSDSQFRVKFAARRGAAERKEKKTRYLLLFCIVLLVFLGILYFLYS